MPQRIFLAAVLAISLPALVEAQYLKGAPMGRQPNAQQAMVQGTIQNMFRRGAVAVLDANGQTWRVAILPATRVRVTGSIAPNNLRSGLIVEFVAPFDEHGKIQGKVGALTVTSITREKPAGVFPSDAPAGGNDGGAGAHAGHPGGKAGPQSAGSYRVVGRLVVQRGALMVQPGRGTVPFELSDKPTIKIDSSDLTIAGVGNEISVTGIVTPGGPLQAYEVQVKLPEPPAGKDEPAAKPDAKQPLK
jgi:hypothetical protein